MKLNTSPSGAPAGSRTRRASSKAAAGRIRSRARVPPQWAGGSKKTRVTVEPRGGRRASRCNGGAERVGAEGVQRLGPPDPSAPRRQHAPSEVAEAADGVSIGGDHETDPSLARRADPRRVKVQPARV